MDASAEQELVKRAQKEPESFGRLFDIYYPKIYAYVYKRTGHVQASQDICSEAFFKAYKKLWQFKFRGLPFSSWLYKIATNEVNNYFNKGKMAPVPTDFLEEMENLSVTLETPEFSLIESQDLNQESILQNKLSLVVHSLPTHYQEVIALRYYEKFSIKEIAEILGKKEGTVKSLLSRGVEKLSSLMQPKQDKGVISTEAPKIINKPL